MGINDMEFHWRWKWSYRPVQRDGTTVAEYYDCFCAWKERMVNFSCPADEGDYNDGFIDNLVWEIRLRIGPKSRSRMSRLSNAFYAAKFEESMMFMEEAFKKIEPHILFDKMPSRIPADKFQVDVSKDSACKVFDKMAESIPTESSSFDQVLGNVNCNSAMTDNDSIPEVIDVGPLLKSEEKSCYDDMVQINDDVAVQIEAGSGKIVSPNADHKVFDELSKPTFTATTPYKLIDEELDVDSGLNSQAEATPKQGFGNSENVALKMFDKSTGAVFTDVFGLGDLENDAVQVLENSIEPFQTGNSPLIQAETKLVDQDKQTFPAGIVTAAYQLFDEVTQPVLAGLQFSCSWHLTAEDEGNDYPSAKIRGLDVHQLFDEGPVKLSLEQIEENDDNNPVIQPIHEGKLSFATNNGIDGHEELVLPTFDLLRTLGPEEAVTEVKSTEISSMTKAKEVTTFDISFWMGEILIFMFDPGGNPPWKSRKGDVNDKLKFISNIGNAKEAIGNFHVTIRAQTSKPSDKSFNFMAEDNAILCPPESNSIMYLEVAYVSTKVSPSLGVYDIQTDLGLEAGVVDEERGSNGPLASWRHEEQRALKHSTTIDYSVDAVKLAQIAVTEKMEIRERRMKEKWVFVCVNVINQEQNDKIWGFNSITEDEGAQIWCYWGYLQRFGGGCLIKLSTRLMMVSLMIVLSSNNHCGMRMWQEKMFGSAIFADDCFVNVGVQNLIRDLGHGKAINLGLGEQLMGNSRTWRLYAWSISNQTQQLPFSCHSMSFLPFQYHSCMLGCFIISDLKHFQRYLSSNGYNGVTIAKLQNFVWDPGQNVVCVYILEDKDGFEREGKRMICKRIVHGHCIGDNEI